ncbi:MAG TPA: SMC family ATPase, partial [Thermoleophilaceae bacterium]
MIPVRVELTNFLSHRRPDGTPVVFDFDGAKLWSVSGDNGAGKSAIFDGITWTLYGMHRGGKQDSQRLISHGADGCVAAFVFDVEGRRYRVERSLRRRGSLKRHAQVFDAASDAWEEIPDSSSEAGFNRWRDELVALSYAAFTHSVLLLQAGSDALIRSGAKDRFEVLAQLVDLSRYQLLEQLAQRHSSELAGRRRRLDEELESVQPVEDDERKAAAAEVERLEEQRRRFAGAVEAQIELLAAAKTHADLVQRRDQASERIVATEKLVVDAEPIRADAQEHGLLTAAGAKLGDGIDALAAARVAEKVAEEARAAGEQIELARLQDEAEQARRAATAASREADESAAKATTLEGVLPAVTAVVERRSELAEAQADVETAGTVADLDRMLKRFRAHVGELEAAAAQAVASRDEAMEARALREAELEEARRQLRERHAAKDEAVCSRCGQPLDEEHRAAELERAEGEVEAAEAAAAAARERHAVLAEAATAAAGARDEAIELGRQAEARRTEAQGAQRTLKRAETAARKALSVARFKRWDDPRRQAFASAEAQALAPALAELEDELEQLNGRVAESKRAAEEAADKARAAEDAHATAVKTRGELERVLDKARAQASAEDRHAAVLLADVPPEWAERAREREDGLLEAFDARRAAVAEGAVKLAALEQAEGELARLRASVEELNAQLEQLSRDRQRDGGPDSAQEGRRRQGLDVASAEQALGAAREQLAGTEHALGDARQQVVALREREEARAAKLAEQGRTGRDARLAARRVQLLSRLGLQGQLLVDATRALESLANEILTQLTGGSLQLEIRFTEQRRRDELSVYARDFNAGGERTDAAFLSGSEKFRVCV